jgi:hypothetical protein
VNFFQKKGSNIKNSAAATPAAAQLQPAFGQAIRNNTMRKLMRNTQRTCSPNLDDSGARGEVNHGAALPRGGTPHRREIPALSKVPCPPRGHDRVRAESPKLLNAVPRALDCSVEGSSTMTPGPLFYSLPRCRWRKGKERDDLIF